MVSTFRLQITPGNCPLVVGKPAIEFRGKRDAKAWRRFFDYCFFGASTLATLLFGVAVGNCMRGIPVGPDMEYTGSFLDLLHPYALVVGVPARQTGWVCRCGVTLPETEPDGRLKCPACDSRYMSRGDCIEEWKSS